MSEVSEKEKNHYTCSKGNKSPGACCRQVSGDEAVWLWFGVHQGGRRQEENASGCQPAVRLQTQEETQSGEADICQGAISCVKP